MEAHPLTRRPQIQPAQPVDPLAPLRQLYKLGLPSAECVLLAFELWQLAGCRAARLTITAAEAAALIGKGDSRSGRNWLSHLERAGLLAIVDRDRRGGRYTIELFDLFCVARVARPADDAQLDLEFDEPRSLSMGAPAEPMTEPGAGPIAESRAESGAHQIPHAESGAHLFPSDGKTCACLSAQNEISGPRRPVPEDRGREDLRPKKEINNYHLTPRLSPTPGPTPNELPPAREPESLGHDLALEVARFSPAAVETQRRDLIARLERAVRDPKFRLAPRIAAAVVEGSFPERLVWELVASLKRQAAEGKIRTTLRQALIAAFRVEFGKRSLAWTASELVEHPP